VTGEVRAHGKNSRGTAWNIGIKRPELNPDVTNLLAAVALVDKAVTTSGSYHNFFEIDGKRYSHILDPKTGAPVQTDLVSVTVLYDDALTADAFDTAFIIVGEERARAIVAAHPGMEAFFVHQKPDGSFFTTKTTGFPAQEPTP
jgi:thiamine biosynthesis lipoprotein